MVYHRKRSDTPVVSTQIVQCEKIYAGQDKVGKALLIIHADGQVEVKCLVPCRSCEWGLLIR